MKKKPPAPKPAKKPRKVYTRTSPHNSALTPELLDQLRKMIECGVAYERAGVAVGITKRHVIRLVQKYGWTKKESA